MDTPGKVRREKHVDFLDPDPEQIMIGNSRLKDCLKEMGTDWVIEMRKVLAAASRMQKIKLEAALEEAKEQREKAEKASEDSKLQKEGPKGRRGSRCHKETSKET